MYTLAFTKQALRALRKMPANKASLIREKLTLLSESPFGAHNNAKKLQGRPAYRLRVGDWRVIYEINNEKLHILVIKIAPRGGRCIDDCTSNQTGG